MTLAVFPNPSADVLALLTAAKPTRWPTATISTLVPSSAITVPHIQYAWDGTPGQQANRQTAAIRITVWAPKAGGVQMTTAVNLAQLVLAYLLDTGSAATWRFRPGAGPTPGVDDATGLPIVTFTVNAETRGTAVA